MLSSLACSFLTFILNLIGKVFYDINELGEKRVLNKKYMKRTYAEICGEG